MRFAAVFAFCLTAFAAWSQNEVHGAPGFVGLVRDDGVWYFTSPEGQPFFSRGVDVVLPFDTAAKPGAPHYDGLKDGVSVDAWARAAASQLAGWNFDTVGDWSHPALNGQGLYTVETIAARIEKNKKLVDVFSPQFEAEVREQVRRVCAPRADDRSLIGYFLENEQPWYGDYGWPTGHASTFLDQYLAFPAGSAGREAAADYLKGKTGGLTSEDRNGFLALAADQYYRVVTTAIREADPHHLILGDRFANTEPREVIRACGRWCDVVSLNYYSGFLQVKPEYLRAFADLSGRPLLITEFSYRAAENRSGLKNTVGATVTVPTQRDRAEHYRRYVTDLARLPFVIGYHWFQYFDESPWGRSFDGEDSNYGLIDIAGAPYESLTEAATAANAEAPRVHAASGQTVIGAPALGDEPVHARFAEPASTTRNYLGPSPHGYGWGDAAHGGTLSPSTSGSSLNARYTTGTGWGAGLSLVPDPEWAPRGYADLSHHRAIELAITAPRGLRFSLLLSEEGAADPWAITFGGAEGSDGESFASEEFTATGSRQTVVVSLETFAFRTSYGNPNGNRTIDLQAVHEIDLSLGGNQGSGTLTVHSLRLTP